MTVAVSGSRTYRDYQYMSALMSHYLPAGATVIHGAARGADTLAQRYCQEYNIPVRLYPADWSKGRSAGILRNQAMADAADMLIAVWDGKSRGTRHMLRACYDRKIPIVLYNFVDKTVKKYNT